MSTSATHELLSEASRHQKDAGKVPLNVPLSIVRTAQTYTKGLTACVTLAVPETGERRGAYDARTKATQQTGRSTKREDKHCRTHHASGARTCLSLNMLATAGRVCSRRVLSQLQSCSSTARFSARADQSIDEWKKLVDAGEKVNPCRR